MLTKPHLLACEIVIFKKKLLNSMLASGGFGVDCSRLKCMRKKRTYRYKCCSINALKTKHRSAGDLNVQSLSRLYFGSNAAWQWQAHVVVYQDATVSKSKVITRLRKRNICSTANICVASVCPIRFWVRPIKRSPQNVYKNSAVALRIIKASHRVALQFHGL